MVDPFHYGPNGGILVVIEEWRPIARTNGYEVSDLGRVRSIDRIVVQLGPWGKPIQRRLSGALLRSQRTGRDLQYQGISLGEQRRELVHRLVAESFLSAPFSAQNQVNHKDGNGQNNSILNLEWVTASENQRHAAALRRCR